MERGEVRVENIDDKPDTGPEAVFVFGPDPTPDIDKDAPAKFFKKIADGTETDADGNPKTFELPDEGDVLEAVEELAG